MNYEIQSILNLMQDIFVLQNQVLLIQEHLTSQIANAIERAIQPRGTAVVIEAEHQCMTTRGVKKPGVSMVTSRMLGAFRDDAKTRLEFESNIRQ